MFDNQNTLGIIYPVTHGLQLQLFYAVQTEQYRTTKGTFFDNQNTLVTIYCNHTWTTEQMAHIFMMIRACPGVFRYIFSF